MNLKQTRLHILRELQDFSKNYRTGISLHCHTQYSKEMLDFVPRYAERLPVISYFWKNEREKYFEREGKYPDFSSAYWSPPLAEQIVYSLEKKQINKAGLEAVVSITDHDTIEGNLKLSAQSGDEKIPISMEWTVPFEDGFFHVGVHNLPENLADKISRQLLDYTFSEKSKDKTSLTEIFALLNSLPEVLLVLNHPLWDIEMVGREDHRRLLKNFIKEHGKWIHAFEINGFRSWSENKAVIEMAEALNIPLVTGGDRHGCRPNTMINLTNSTTFDEFAEEIRVDRCSEIALLPEYAQPLQWRQLQSFADILRFYPEFSEGRQKWFDRVYVDIGDSFGLRQLSVHWKQGGPPWLRWAIKFLGVLGHERMQSVFRLAMKPEDILPRDLSEMRFEIPNMEEFKVKPETKELHHTVAC
jgi:hypothetical protein